MVLTPIDSLDLRLFFRLLAPSNKTFDMVVDYYWIQCASECMHRKGQDQTVKGD